MYNKVTWEELVTESDMWEVLVTESDVWEVLMPQPDEAKRFVTILLSLASKLSPPFLQQLRPHQGLGYRKQVV